MSTAVAPALSPERIARRIAARFRIAIPVDVTVLRSGIPDSVPGRSLNLGNGGMGAAVAAELFPGESVGVEFRLPYVGLPLQARALVRYQDRLHYGLQFLGLTAEQQAMLGYWSRRTAEAHPETKLAELTPKNLPLNAPEVTSESLPASEQPHLTLRRRHNGRGLAMSFALLMVITVLGWWHWQRGWRELETHLTDRNGPRRDRRGLRRTQPLFFLLFLFLGLFGFPRFIDGILLQLRRSLDNGDLASPAAKRANVHAGQPSSRPCTSG